ncbi:FRG domain-containing protein [Burkholderia glumae]|uniref:FRG domain-containing protein n=1 Tax=Burkholderia glumae TaxID=337 RepID=A0AAQ0BSZ8_BURGL|nr:FRG domain-containing protein [Burkholderia glumae]QPQ91870.1 FRG domain-containing protein [Burkholderia glumae]QQM89918.1 FRG domain-containing protein [Burkholderia glumae]
METTRIESIEELREITKKYGARYLFRGQTKHYFDSTGAPNMPTSFERHGCIPPLMFKWTHYAKAIIRALGGGAYDALASDTVQAVLQHYGWRSFYIDLTKSLAVACWFASHKYSDDMRIHMCENYEEDPVWLIHREASYTAVSEGDGHLYVVDTEVLKQGNVGVFDLTEIEVEDGPIRFHAQHACLAGSVRRLPPEAVVSHIVVNMAVLQAYAKDNGFCNTVDLFPGERTDIVLRALLSIPWFRIRDAMNPIPAFRRGLDLPEYNLAFVKHLPPETILFDKFWIADNRADESTPLQLVPFYRMAEDSYYSNVPRTFELPETTKLLRENSGFAIELDGVIRPPEFLDSYACEKGIYVERMDGNLVSVGALYVEHPANVVCGAGVSAGWIYRVDGDVWTRVPNDDQCPCNNDLPHELQFTLLNMFEIALKDAEFKQVDALNFTHKGLNL